MVRTKVFVGNLSFATKENDLAKEFEASGKVISANIITRGPRSLGYGFVEMDNENDANNAVKLLNKKEIDGRPINVEVAKPREEGAEGENKQQGAEGARGRGARGGRGRGTRGRGRGGRGRGGEQSGEGGNFRRRTAPEDQGEEGEAKRSERGGRGGRGRGAPRGRGAERVPRPAREEKKEDTRQPSKTTLFVANLPFSLDDDGFAKILKESNLTFKSAHVVKKRSGRSKGFGFVEFENEVDQQKTLTAINNKQVEGRELVVKVALTENKPETATEEKKEEKKVEEKPTTPKTEQKK